MGWRSAAATVVGAMAWLGCSRSSGGTSDASSFQFGDAVDFQQGDGSGIALGDTLAASDAPVAASTCPVKFRVRPNTLAGSVFVVGEWNRWAPQAHPLKDDGKGNFEASIEVPSGDWGYKFTVNGQDVADAANLDQVWRHGGWVAQVRACMAKGAFHRHIELPPGWPAEAATVTLRTPDGLQFPASVWQPVAANAVTQHADYLDVRLSGLKSGKHTLRITAAKAELRVPFWVDEPHFAWTDSPMYMAMLDRFANGDPGNDPQPMAKVPKSADFQGGDLAGLEKAIDAGYFQQLGVRTLWVSPWPTQPTVSSPELNGPNMVSGYHGYWPIKAREVDPRFGGGAALAAMVRKAHANGIRVVMDAVFNQVFKTHEYMQSHPDWFRTTCVCGAPGCDWEALPSRYYCQFAADLPDVNWTLPAVQQQFSADLLWWLDTFDIDGVRVDAVKHMEPEGLKAATKAVRAHYDGGSARHLLFGESFSGDEGLLKAYIGPDLLDSQLNFPWWFAVPETVFGRDDQGLQTAKNTTLWDVGAFGPLMVRFIDSHDSARFITKADFDSRDKQGQRWDNLPPQPTDQRAYDRLFLALAAELTVPGIPLLYYGDEYGEHGGSDPDNRHFMRQAKDLGGQQASQLERTRKLFQARTKLRGLSRGPLVQMWTNNDPWGAAQAGGGNLWAFARPDPDPAQGALVVLSLKYEPWSDIHVQPPAELGWQDGTLEDLLTGKTWPLKDGKATVEVGGRTLLLLRRLP
jgi:glycosidase